MATACTNGIDTGFVALGYAKVAVLGVVQGITELMPISSTAHMRIAPALFGWQDPGSAFSAAMQLAALAAVIGYFWRDVKDILHGSLSALARRDFSNHSLKFAFGIVIGTIPIGIAGLALAKTLNTCGSPLRELWVVGAACLVMAFLLGLAELAARHQRSFDRVGLLDCLLVGIAQVGALIPGVSRSGSTLTAALFLGFRREDAARLSFLLGLPAIALAGLKELAELRHAGLDAHGWAVLGIGLVVASLSAFVAIWGLLRILENFSAWPFAVYRALIGAVLLASLATGWLS
ncbi:MAG TPA: undecaprenyl-diphosphate phosphatase [Stellaceae bacterium]|nr:undecaprenyl-diphosphate phosphatase [Stellaceae bacterium]